MRKAFLTSSLAAAAIAASAFAASAATLNIDGSGGITGVAFNGSTTYVNYRSDCNTSGSFNTASCYNPSGPAGSLTETLTVFDKYNTTAQPNFSYPGLTMSGAPALVQVTFLGKEASYTNAALSMGGTDIIYNTDAIGSSYTFWQTANAPTALDFTFKTTSTSTLHEAGYAGFAGGAAIAFSQVYGSGIGSYVYAYFDDSGAASDREFDDMVVKISIIPLPATGILLLGGLVAGFGALRRRKRAA